jgi:hypothetical protein
VIKPIQENRISRQIRSAPAPGDVSAGQDAPQQRSRTTDRPPLMGVEHVPSNGAQQVRRRAVYREPARRINIAGGVLVLPAVVYYGVPVILNVPELGYVDVPEDEYARLYDKLSSSDSEQVQEAMSSLRKLKEREEAEVEAGAARAGKDGTRQCRGFERANFFRLTVEDENSSEGTLLTGHTVEPRRFARGGPQFAPK